MDLAYFVASSTNHHLFSSLDGQPQNGWPSIFWGAFFSTVTFCVCDSQLFFCDMGVSPAPRRGKRS
jgi:hypothetical protein